ncbi:MAG: PDZ domain-containing protein, partial [Akkermansiaceae bacterium]
RLGRIVKDSETTLNTDCKVIGGDSGGPLFDMEGNLIGIHSRVSATMEENMHVPMREYIKHWDKMEADEFVGDGPFAKRPVKGSGFLGIGTTDSEDGVLIGKVMEKTPGAKAGLKTGDIILELDGVKMTKKAQFSAAVKEKSEGDELILLISRKGKKQTIKVTLGKR